VSLVSSITVKKAKKEDRTNQVVHSKIKSQTHNK